MSSMRQELHDALTLIAQAVIVIGGVLFVGHLLSPETDTGSKGNPMTTGMECQEFAQGVVCR
ncbi:MAG: hypothetical protein EOR77_21455 [Mesorhizobium sp.]|uniref:hypothetical protein n=1 Tax=Mesorhizobium sp. TaxID=1871066 RepID=UPI000FE4D503|nr:hypothetical protein [Mesorhizobium sp.]RWM32599.1 MAG: hypothetical protein EOR77_21455 [Mesorhizobium sp.]